MPVAELQMTSGTVDGLVSHLRQHTYKFPCGVRRRHSYSENHGAFGSCGSSGTVSRSSPKSRRSASVTGSPISPAWSATASSRFTRASERVSPWLATPAPSSMADQRPSSSCTRRISRRDESPSRLSARAILNIDTDTAKRFGPPVSQYQSVYVVSSTDSHDSRSSSTNSVSVISRATSVW